MPGTWVCRIGAAIGALGGLGTALVVGGEIAGKLIDLGVFDDTRAWELALMGLSGIVGAMLGGGSALAGLGCMTLMTRRLVAISWLLILAGAAITPAGDFLAWAGVAAWVAGLALQVAGIMRARRWPAPTPSR